MAEIITEGDVNDLASRLSYDVKRNFIFQGVKTKNNPGLEEKLFYYGFTNGEGKNSIIASSNLNPSFKNVAMDESTLRKDDDGKLQRIGANRVEELLGPYDGSIGDIIPVMSSDAILRSCKGEKIDKQYLYEKMKRIFLEYMDFGGKDEIADVLSCWAIATHCYTLFDWFPHIFFNAPRESGKSKCAKLLLGMSFGGYDIGASCGATPAQLFRTIEMNRGTILLDEFEQEFDKKLASEAQKLINQMFNASCDSDSYIIRNEKTDDGKGWIPRKFNIYCPKIIANISGINDVTLTRSIAFSWLKTSSDKGKKKVTKGIKHFLASIRDECQMLMLDDWIQIDNIYQNIEIPANCRQEDNWKSVLSVAKYIGSEAEKGCMKYLEEYADVIIETNDTARDFFAALEEELPEQRQKYYARDIALMDSVQAIIGWMQGPANWVGKKMREYKFRSKRDGRGSHFSLCKADIKTINDKYWPINIYSVDCVDDEDRIWVGKEGVSTPNSLNNYTKQHLYISTPSSQTSQEESETGLGSGEVPPSEARPSGKLLPFGVNLSFGDIQKRLEESPTKTSEYIEKACMEGILMKIGPDKWRMVSI